jgi:D-arginine dehydrogenase
LNFDFIVAGGGIVGASCAYFLAQHGSVALLEGEDHFGYHATGRSAAVFSEYFGNPTVQMLTAASRSFFERPPEGLVDLPLLWPRGVIALADHADIAEGRFDGALSGAAHALLPPYEISLDQARMLCPILAPQHYRRALYRPSVMDIDVDALHQGLLRQVRARGGKTQSGAAVLQIGRCGGIWSLSTKTSQYHAPVLVNAAGAWADELAALAGVATIGLLPKRRTAVLVELAANSAQSRPLHQWPMITDLSDTFYFKPESGGLLVCPCDETVTCPGDTQAEELDIATAVARLEAVTNLSIRRIKHQWAGLRSFVMDETPVLGASADAPGFFWAAALGGFGVQTAPAIGATLASLVTAKRLPCGLAAQGLREVQLSPSRCRGLPSTSPISDLKAYS